MDATEKALVAISKVPANAGHPLHKGTPREAFIKGFLQSHLPENLAVGTGELIDAASQPNAPRNQFDIVLYKKNYPKLDFGGGINGFLIESVIATIEVKSTLTQKDLEQAIIAARASKGLSPSLVTSFHAGYIPPRVLNYVVAYEGPAAMETVYNWIPSIHAKLGISIPNLPVGAKRIQTPSPSIDGVFILEKGFLYFDNMPFGFITEEFRVQNPDFKWVFQDTATGNLLLFFMFLQTATANIEGKWLHAHPYLHDFGMPGVRIGK